MWKPAAGTRTRLPPLSGRRTLWLPLACLSPTDAAGILAALGRAYPLTAPLKLGWAVGDVLAVVIVQPLLLFGCAWHSQSSLSLGISAWMIKNKLAAISRDTPNSRASLAKIPVIRSLILNLQAKRSGCWPKVRGSLLRCQKGLHIWWPLDGVSNRRDGHHYVAPIIFPVYALCATGYRIDNDSCGRARQGVCLQPWQQLPPVFQWRTLSLIHIVGAAYCGARRVYCSCVSLQDSRRRPSSPHRWPRETQRQRKREEGWVVCSTKPRMA